MIYAFSGLYQHAFDVDSEEFLPDEQLRAYQKLGINGILTPGVLSKLALFPFDPTLSAGYETRLERMRAMTETPPSAMRRPIMTIFLRGRWLRRWSTVNIL